MIESTICSPDSIDRIIIEEYNRDLNILIDEWRDLNYIMQDVQLVVNSQGENLNKIEDDIDLANDHYDDATVSLESVINYKSRIRIKIILITTGAVAGAVIGGAIGGIFGIIPGILGGGIGIGSGMLTGFIGHTKIDV